MDAIDRYIERLDDPGVRASWRRINGIDEAGPGPGDGSRVGEEQVTIAERGLGVTLPPSYRTLVTTTEPYDNVYGLYWITDSGEFCADIANSRVPPFLIDHRGNRVGERAGRGDWRESPRRLDVNAPV